MAVIIGVLAFLASAAVAEAGMPSPVEIAVFFIPGIVTLLIVILSARRRSRSTLLPVDPATVDRISREMRTPSASRRRATGTPAWFLPAGIIAVIIGTLGFLASAAVAGDGDLFMGLFVGLLNPLFFVGLPLGIYWLVRYSKSSQHPPVVAQSQPPPVVAQTNPKLTRCPDCDGHVSRLAHTCPHCGRPLEPVHQ